MPAANLSVIMDGMREEEFRIQRGLKGFLKRGANFVARRARANAPIKSGHLRSQIRVTEVEGDSDSFTISIVDDSEYSWLMHELLQPYGSGNFNLGPISLAQGPTPEGGVGGRYISRVVFHHSNALTDALLETAQKFEIAADEGLLFSSNVE